VDGEDDDRERLSPKFDGTIASLADCYEYDDDSAYQELKTNSAEGYKPWLKMVRKTVGARLVGRVVAKDFRRWYRNWKKISTTRGTDGTRQAYGGIQIIRILLSYGAEAGFAKCRQLRDDMKGMRFGKQDFVYLPEEDAYRCPVGEKLPYRFTGEEGGKRLRRYCTG
jgi:hypothetical protein